VHIEFAVDGKNFPGVSFDIGESYAGLLPITSDPSDPDQIFFWFFPTTNPESTKEITIWLQGGPGCSSLTGLLQENGPFLWPPGVYQPYPNHYSWTNLTNMVWIDQPSGIGLAQGNTSVADPIDAAHQFMGFWRNFVKTFALQGFKINIVGESYGGAWVSYFSDEMLKANDTTNFNLVTAQLQDAYIGDFTVQTYVPVVQAAKRLNNIFNLNATFMAELEQRNIECGFEAYYDTYVNAYPPAGPLPPSPDVTADCDVLDDFWWGLLQVNPCTNVYHIIDVCPFLWTSMGFDSYAYNPFVFFNRSDVQTALHVPPTNYMECGKSGPGLGLLYNDNTPPPGLGGPLPSVISRLNKTIISSGGLDFALFSDGARFVIQNMTWRGLQGFQTAPPKSVPEQANFFVPYHPGLAEIYDATIQGDDSGVSVPFLENAGAGLLGVTHTERGLTFVDVFAAGHRKCRPIFLVSFEVRVLA
jgi:carboxypeptidase D